MCQPYQCYQQTEAADQITLNTYKIYRKPSRSNIASQLANMEDTPANRSHLMDLPNEILQLIIIRMARRDQVSFRRVCRHIYDLTIQVLYHSIVTQRRTAKDINSFIHSFVTRPQIIHFVQELTIDEVDPVAIRRLLSIPFPELKKLSIKQTDQWPRTVINETEKAALNGSIKRQPKLKDCEFSLHHASFVVVTNTSTSQSVSLLESPANELIL